MLYKMRILSFCHSVWVAFEAFVVSKITSFKIELHEQNSCYGIINEQASELGNFGNVV